MRNKNLTFLAISLVWLALFKSSALAASTHDPAIHLTLDQSISEAITNSTAVLKTQNSDALNGAAVLLSYGQFLPNLVANGNYGHETGKQLYVVSGLSLVDSRATTSNYNISTTLNLFNGLADLAQFRASADRKSASEFSVSWAKQQVALDVTQSYLQVTLDQQILEFAKKNLTASQGRLALLQGQADVGAVSSADLYRQQAQTASDEQYLINSETKLHDDQLIVIQKIRVDPTRNYILDPPPLQPEPQPDVKKDEDTLIADAISAREDYKAQSKVLDATDWDITRARSGYLPQVNLSFSLMGSGEYLDSLSVNGVASPLPSQQPMLAQLGNQKQWDLQLTFSWNIFDRFLTHYNVEQALVYEDNTRVDRDDLRIQVASEVRQILVDYNEAQKQVASTNTGVVAAQKAYQLISARYREGQQSFIDLLAAQATYLQAQATHAQALTTLKLQERLVQYYLGKYRYDQYESNHNKV